MKNHPQIISYLSGESTPDQMASFQEWLNESLENQELFNSVKSIWEGHLPDQVPQEQLATDWSQLEVQIEELGKSEHAQTHRRINSSWVIRAAAVILILLSTGIIWSIQKSHVILRGAQTAPVAYILPDGSEVYLSLGSKLKYAKNFGDGKRIVELFGEAHFDVQSNPLDPFIVNTGEAKIRVTGTSFLVSALDHKKEVAVQVKAGKVLFYNSETLTENAFRVSLGPGDKGTYLPKLKQLNKTHAKSLP